MPPFEGFGGLSSSDPIFELNGIGQGGHATADQLAFHFDMMKQASNDDDDEEDEDEDQPEDDEKNHDSKENDNKMGGLSSKSRLFGNPPSPFPNEALLEKLSNKLALEEQESLN